MTYNHMYTLAFAVKGSKKENAKDVTQDKLVAALLDRISDLIKNKEMKEAVGAPDDTFEESDEESFIEN